MPSYATGFVALDPDWSVTGGIEELGTTLTSPEGEIAIEGVSVVPRATFCLLPSVWFRALVSLVLAAESTFCSGVRCFWRFSGFRPNFVRSSATRARCSFSRESG